LPEEGTAAFRFRVAYQDYLGHANAYKQRIDAACWTAPKQSPTTPPSRRKK
jgi:hypothetical protein